jgi:hypothetical protein
MCIQVLVHSLHMSEHTFLQHSITEWLIVLLNVKHWLLAQGELHAVSALFKSEKL